MAPALVSLASVATPAPAAEAPQRTLPWLLAFAEQHKDWGLDLVRMHLGVGLTLKGAWFLFHEEALAQMVANMNAPYTSLAIAHYVVMAHLFFGPLLALGVLTRAAALVQLPAVLGAVFFVHAHEALFSAAPNLELSLLVATLLGAFAVFGAGRLSVDHRMQLRMARQAAEHPGRPATA